MKRTLLITSLALALTGILAHAQATQEAPAPAPQQQTRQHAPNPHREAMRLTRQLSLTPDQTAKLEPILATRDQKLADLKADPNSTPQTIRQQRRAIQMDTQQQLSTVLTPDQLQQMKAMHHHGGPAQQPDPSAAPAPPAPPSGM